MTLQQVEDDGRPKLDPSSEKSATSVLRWRDSYRRNLVITDTVIATVVVFASQALRVSQRTRVSIDGFGSVNYFVISTLLTGLWLLALWANGAYDQKVLGTGASEYGRILRASLYLFGFIAIVSYLLQAEVARSYLAIALPLGLFGLMGGRWVWRQLLLEYRKAGSHLNSVLIIGGLSSAAALAERLRAAPAAGMKVAGIWVPPSGGRTDSVDVSVAPQEKRLEATQQIEAVMDAVRNNQADTIAVAASESFGSEAVRQLGWKIEGTGVRLALAPTLTDVAGPRIHIRPVAGLPLMYVDEARFRGPKLITKTLLDLGLAALGIIVLGPLMLVVAGVIKLRDPGPVFFRQERVGRSGQHFRIWKFRTMVANAETQLTRAKREAGQADGVFYKSSADDRITPVGRFLRKTSIDELPQLFNVIAGQMSIVGPRPLVPGEGAEIKHFLERRRLVRPGITGLWQVSGRSDLDAAERIRLDSYYVENWSVAGDMLIIARTIKAVFAREGAY